MTLPVKTAVRRPALLAMILIVLVALSDGYPWYALTATVALVALWFALDRVKRWWKSGTADFEKIMEEELGR